MKDTKKTGKKIRFRYPLKALLLCAVVTNTLFYLFWEKSGSEVKPTVFQKVYAQRTNHFTFSPADTILVIAPHCDDEVLGAGGLIYDVRSQGAQVYVVVITNGDAFRILWTRTKRAVELGYRRQQETLSALQILGVPRENVFFLGYPDQGLALLWNEHWSSTNPYFSRFTRNWMDSYFTSYRPGSPYSGENLVLELKNIIARVNPTTIITASPFDRHPDHWATYNFTMYTLEKMDMQDMFPLNKPKVYWYLTHYGIWPYAFGFRPKALLLPPPNLCLPQLEWQIYFPSPFAGFAKIRAIRKYQSQSPIGEHLLSFARKNELFGQSSFIEIPTVSFPITIDGKTEEWPSAIPSHQEPQQEKIWKKRTSFSRFMVARDHAHLYLAFLLDQSISTKNMYHFRLNLISTFSENQDVVQSFSFTLQVKNQKTISSRPEIQAAMRERVIELAIPLELLRHSPRVFFQAEIQRSSKKTLGTTSWYLFRLLE
ncbi:MAG: PIG-L family deacetylase [Candidatus Caldatribacteriaceae bacterium]